MKRSHGGREAVEKRIEAIRSWVLMAVRGDGLIVAGRKRRYLSDPTMPVRPEHPWVAAAGAGPRFGGGLGPQTLPDCIEFVQLAEELGFDSYWANDHPTRTADPWTVLTALAATTHKIRLGSFGGCVSL